MVSQAAIDRPELDHLRAMRTQVAVAPKLAGVTHRPPIRLTRAAVAMIPTPAPNSEMRSAYGSKDPYSRTESKLSPRTRVKYRCTTAPKSAPTSNSTAFWFRIAWSGSSATTPDTARTAADRWTR